MYHFRIYKGHFKREEEKKLPDFYKVPVPFYILSNRVCEFPFSTFSPILVIVGCFYCSCSSGCEVISN